jgi:small-conductance mechanosensitive channel
VLEYQGTRNPQESTDLLTLLKTTISERVWTRNEEGKEIKQNFQYIKMIQHFKTNSTHLSAQHIKKWMHKHWHAARKHLYQYYSHLTAK